MTTVNNNTNALEVKNVVKYFHDPSTFQVLKGVSFDVKKGEFLSLVGKSGSGKSTLLYILSTMDTDYEGSLSINGNMLTGQNQNQLSIFRNEHIGFVFQFHYLLPEFSALENVMLPAKKLGKLTFDEIEHKAYESLRLLDLEEQALKGANKLSGGQQQRVAIARALINSPSIIMGDEPTGNLDSKNSMVVQDIFRNLAHEFGQTIICVTHDNDFAQRTDRTIEMTDGLISNH
ncbi:MAG: lipoprotein releasing system ATP-binding protein LolD [Bacteroidetes bacterium]|nr:lipoprotein releasing system ATP-binding protein LolD [Bacteroidota bacterium]